MRVKDADVYEEEDKSIKRVTFKETEVDNPKKLTLSVAFGDTKTISSDLKEPDVLQVELLLPEIIIDAQTYDSFD